jgi:hypothetical protein
LRLDLRAQLLKIVDFTVVAKHEALISGKHRLIASGTQIDDGQAPMEKGDAVLPPRAEAIWTSVRQHGPTFTAEGFGSERRCTSEFARNSTHMVWQISS